MIKTLASALAMVIFPAMAFAQSTDVNGWNGAKWGMTLAQVRAAVTSPLERDPHQLYPRRTSVFRTSEPFKLLDAPVWALFSFSSDDKLIDVEIRVDTPFLDSTSSQSELFDRFKQSLIEKYGKPKFTDDNGRTVVWNLSTTSIRLVWTEFGGHPFMAVTYNQANKQLPTSYVWRQSSPDSTSRHGQLRSSGLEMLTDTEGIDFNPYLLTVLLSVRQNWYAIVPPSVESGQKGMNTAEFRVLQDGKVPADFLKLTVRSGKEEFDRASLTAIRAATPFSHLPEEFSHSFVTLRITFYYNMPRKSSDQRGKSARSTLGPD